MILAFISWVFYLSLSLIFHRNFGYHILIISLLPVALTSSYLGSRKGTLVALSLVFYNFVIIFFSGNQEILTEAGFIGGSAVTILLAWTVGVIKDVNQGLNSELDKRKKNRART